MSNTVAVAGSTGNLGGRIVRELRNREVAVKALVRPGAKPEKVKALQDLGATIVSVDLANKTELQHALAGSTCVVSALLGLRDVMVEAQGALLDATVAADVRRFIPSDYCLDFMQLRAGENRNLDLHREFAARIEKSPVQATSVLNGAFAEMLAHGMMLLDKKGSRVTYWEDADQELDFTTMDNTAAFTAAVACDEKTPRWLQVAGFRITARELTRIVGHLKSVKYTMVSLGTLDELEAQIKEQRAAAPESEKEIFPRWQGGQYTHNMFSGRGQLKKLDNGRYPDIKWTSLPDVLAKV